VRLAKRNPLLSPLLSIGSAPKTAPNPKVGPWQRTDYDNFLRLLEATRDRSGALSNDPTERVGGTWKAVRAHPVYRQLIENKSFRLAQRAFREHILWKLDPWAHFSFLWIFVFCAGVYHDAAAKGPRPRLSPNAKKKNARARERTRANAAKLLDDLEAGVESAPATDVLRHALQSFMRATKRKPSDRGDMRAKTVTQMFANSLLVAFGADPAVPKVVASWAKMVNCGLGAKAVKWTVKRAEQKWRAMAKTGEQWPIVQGAKV
jgi:hypothetical protein